MEYSSHQPAPNWLEVDRENMKGRVTALPKREDVNLPVNEQLIVELYQQVDPVVRESSGLSVARLPNYR